MQTKHNSCVKSPTGGHFWKIEPQNGKTSKSVCKYCHTEKILWNCTPNGVDDTVIIIKSPHKEGLYSLSVDSVISRYR
jgi:hypothetical protein